MSKDTTANARELLEVDIGPRKLLTWNLWIILILLLFHLVGRTIRFGFDHDYAWGIVPLSNLNDEHNFPSLYSAMLFFANALLCGLLSIAEKKTGRASLVWFWRLAAAVAAFLGCDEILVLHERLDTPMRQLIAPSGYFHYGWILPYLVLFGFIGVASLKLFLQLPMLTRRELIKAGVVFLAGAVGCELWGGKIASQQGVLNLAYVVSATLEEVLEMLGLSLALSALWAHMLREYKGLILTHNSP